MEFILFLSSDSLPKPKGVLGQTDLIGGDAILPTPVGSFYWIDFDPLRSDTRLGQGLKALIKAIEPMLVAGRIDLPKVVKQAAEIGIGFRPDKGYRHDAEFREAVFVGTHGLEANSDGRICQVFHMESEGALPWPK